MQIVRRNVNVRIPTTVETEQLLPASLVVHRILQIARQSVNLAHQITVQTALPFQHLTAVKPIGRIVQANAKPLMQTIVTIERQFPANMDVLHIFLTVLPNAKRVKAIRIATLRH